MSFDNENKQITVLVTGGAGFVGSHCSLLLLQHKFRVVVVDNCSNTYRANKSGPDAIPESLLRVEKLSSKTLSGFYDIDLVDQSNREVLDKIFIEHDIKVVLHFAALKSVNESIDEPLAYYENNIVGTINLLRVMDRNKCRKMIFSSSATVYGLPQYLPVDELHKVGENILNPYGRTKNMIEQVLRDMCRLNEIKEKSDSLIGQPWNIIALRYFNPTGAHPTGYIGEHTRGIPNNLMPYVAQVSVGKRDRLYVFGDDFDTPDGTGVRDFIHILDLAEGHLSALNYLLSKEKCFNIDGRIDNCGYESFNLGTGRGFSVLEVIKTFESVNNVRIPYEIVGRRDGDAGSVYADPSLAERVLGWKAKLTLTDMCRDIYKWQTEYPNGFASQAAATPTI